MIIKYQRFARRIFDGGYWGFSVDRLLWNMNVTVKVQIFELMMVNVLIQ